MRERKIERRKRWKRGRKSGEGVTGKEFRSRMKVRAVVRVKKRKR